MLALLLLLFRTFCPSSPQLFVGENLFKDQLKGEKGTSQNIVRLKVKLVHHFRQLVNIRCYERDIISTKQHIKANFSLKILNFSHNVYSTRSPSNMLQPDLFYERNPI